MEDWEDEERLNTDLNSVGFSSGDISGSEFEKKLKEVNHLFRSLLGLQVGKNWIRTKK